MSQTALVTGATSGIGEALCLLFASDGYDLVTVARDEEALEKQAEELRILGVDVLPVACDLSDPDSARTIFKRVQKADKEIEILVNDAGYSPAGQFSDLPISDIRAMIQVSVTSLAELTSVFLHPMIERGHGRILNMSSMMAKTPCPYNALYGAAKVFVLSFSAALARELRATGVSVTTVCPGATRTNFPKNAGIEGAPAWKYFSMSPDETAIRVYRALMRGERCAVTGWVNKVGALGVRFMPMGLQLMAGEWLLGTRKHPLGHEGTEEGAKGANAEGREGGSARKRQAAEAAQACGGGRAGNNTALKSAQPDTRAEEESGPHADARAFARGIASNDGRSGKNGTAEGAADQGNAWRFEQHASSTSSASCKVSWMPW
ncbi:short-chain dehydrogenase [Gordonibacter sp. An230]|uniref:SDR family NAD(P)-dependent oxidoreductase n=1 Tax=Gordonibacter sp. An230 TaxID=1965592 RepID=UPI000B568B44|nr:SDR family oxidoreductase [Gordonibacter sp. An230]OUO86532.1 short-chain dehydrogenase [Gordonibacter sp. An230]